MGSIIYQLILFIISCALLIYRNEYFPAATFLWEDVIIIFYFIQLALQIGYFFYTNKDLQNINTDYIPENIQNMIRESSINTIS